MRCIPIITFDHNRINQYVPDQWRSISTVIFMCEDQTTDGYTIIVVPAIILIGPLFALSNKVHWSNSWIQSGHNLWYWNFVKFQVIFFSIFCGSFIIYYFINNSNKLKCFRTYRGFDSKYQLLLSACFSIIFTFVPGKVRKISMFVS